MKILHLNCNYAGTYLHETMINHLEKITDKNFVYCPVRYDYESERDFKDNVLVSPCFRSVDRYSFFYKQFKIYKDVKSKVNINEYDVLHAYTLFTDGNVAYRLHDEFHLPYVVAIRATDLLFMRLRPYLRTRGLEILRNASAVFFLSETMKDLFYSKYVSETEIESLLKKTHIIPNGIDEFYLNNIYERDFDATYLRLQRKELYVVCVSQIIPRKKIPLIIYALNQLEREGYKVNLKVIGRAVDNKLLNEIRRSDFVEYISPKKKEELIQYYRDADIFALVSSNETFGLVYAEAMTQGLPVIYKKREGFDGQFSDGLIGVSSEATVDDVVTAFKKVIENYSYMAKNCIEKCKIFNWNDIVERYVSIYKDVSSKETA